MTQHRLTQSAILTLDGLDAWVDVPFGPDANVDILELEYHLRKFNLELMPTEEEEPEIIGPETMRILCLPTWAMYQQSDDSEHLAEVVPLPIPHPAPLRVAQPHPSNFPYAGTYDGTRGGAWL